MSQHEKPSQNESRVLDEKDLQAQLEVVEYDLKAWQTQLDNCNAEYTRLTKGLIGSLLHSKKIDELLKRKGRLIEKVNNLHFQKRDIESALRTVQKHGKVKAA